MTRRRRDHDAAIGPDDPQVTEACNVAQDAHGGVARNSQLPWMMAKPGRAPGSVGRRSSPLLQPLARTYAAGYMGYLYRLLG